MKKRKIIAAVLAALMLAGCGRVEDEVTPAAANDNNSGQSAVTPVSGSEASSESGSLSSDGNEGFEAESGSMEKTEEEPGKNGAAGYFGTYINDKNCILISGLEILDDGEEDEDYENRCMSCIADRQLLYYCAERVIDQYNCIADRDKRGFFDTIGYSDVFKCEDAAMFWAISFLGEKNDYRWNGICMLGSALDYSYYLVGDKLYAANDKYSADSIIPNTDHTRDEVLAEYREIMDEAAEKATFENSEEFIDKYTCFNKLLRKSRSITNEEYFASPEKFRLEPSDDAIYIIDMFNGWLSPFNDGANEAVIMSVTVLDGDYAYNFGDCSVWLTEKSDHVLPFAAAVCENPYKGKTREEIEAERPEDIRSYFYQAAPPTPAEAAKEGANYQFSEGIYECDDDDDRSIWERIIGYGSYAQSVSDEGLDISADISYERRFEFGIGDYQIIYTMRDYGYDSGTVWLRPEPDGSGDFYVIYESSDGQREEYHGGQDSWY